RLQALDQLAGVLVVRRGDDDRVEVLGREHVLEAAEGARLFVGRLLDRVGAEVAVTAPYVADRGDLCLVRLAQLQRRAEAAAAAAAGADYADGQALVAVGGAGRGGGQQAGGRGAEEVTTGEIVHGVVSGGVRVGLCASYAPGLSWARRTAMMKAS